MNDGGPAFPCSTWTEKDGVQIGTPVSGMSLRDYFAAKAMQGMLSVHGVLKSEAIGEVLIAQVSYQIADAMLAARDSETLSPLQGGYGG